MAANDFLVETVELVEEEMRKKLPEQFFFLKKINGIFTFLNLYEFTGVFQITKNLLETNLNCKFPLN